MTEEFDLSAFRIDVDDRECGSGYAYPDTMVKEFIRLLKEIIDEKVKFSEPVLEEIDKLAGDKLVSGESEGKK